jgi:hypothetical protein
MRYAWNFWKMNEMETPMEFFKIYEKIQFTIGWMKDDFASNNILDE